MKTPTDIAIEQREYWLSVVRDNKDHTITQQAPGEHPLPTDPLAISPATWAEYWNLQVTGEQRR